MKYDYNRRVGEESLKTYKDKIDNGFFDKYMSGRGLDIGYAGYIPNARPILDNAIGITLDYPGYDGVTLPFLDGVLDFIYSSHVLEHIQDRLSVMREWFRVLKPGGYIICVVPHRDLYEKKLIKPSLFNEDHKVFYTPSSLLLEFEKNLPYNSFRVRHLQDNDKGHDYSQLPEEHSKGEYEIELVIQKL